ncbi:MAG TPA: phosphopantetheine-binding protein, partial [Herpetosiphonaceae bacterium]
LTQLVARIRAVFQIELPLRSVYEAATIAELAQELIAREPRPGQTEKIAQLLLKIKRMSSAEKQASLQAREAQPEQGR